MKERVKLDPRIIIGDLALETPLFVVIYILKYCKKIPFRETYYQVDSFYQETIDKINSFEWQEILIPSDSSDELDLLKLIKFISPQSSGAEWYVENIINGYNHLISFSLNIDLPPISKSSLIFGHKSNSQPTKFNELIVFRLIKHLKYKFDRTTTLEEATDFLERFYSGRIKSLKNSLLHNIQSMDDSTLLKIYQTVNSLHIVEENDYEVSIKNQGHILTFDFDELKMNMTLSELNDRRKLISKLTPKTHYEAMIISAIKDDLDISSSSAPLKEFENLKRRNYIPYCPNFSKNYHRNREFYRISRSWSSNLSNPIVYSIEQMNKFTIDEGFEVTKGMTFSEYQSYMKSTKLITNFYFGYHPECDKTKTIMLTPISELNYDSIICFGIEDVKIRNDMNLSIKNEQDRNIDKIIDPHALYYISIEELVEFFKMTKIFINPVSKEPLDLRVIKKLKNYCSKMIISKSQISSEFSSMLSTIEDLEKIRKFLDLRLLQLKNKIEKSKDPDIRENIGLFFMKVMEMGLYMRGWKVNGTDKYPLKSEDTTPNEWIIMPRHTIPDSSVYIDGEGNEIPYTGKQFVVDRTVLSLNEAKSVLAELPTEISDDIKLLHTLRFDKAGKPEEIMGMIFKGVHVYNSETLVECMGNIFKGMIPDESCIRTNSSWILFSSIWYLMMLGYSTPFTIDKIDDIK